MNVQSLEPLSGNVDVDVNEKASRKNFFNVITASKMLKLEKGNVIAPVLDQMGGMFASQGAIMSQTFTSF